MAHIAITGARGFLGWHTRSALRESGASTEAIGVGDEFNLESAVAILNGASRLLHIAGANRGQDSEIRLLNERFARQVAAAVVASESPPPVIVFANSTQVTRGTAYGEGKALAADILSAAAQTVGAEFLNVLLPNLFGEHGRPFYNAVTATFCHLIANGEKPTVEIDRELRLLHAQDAADILIGAAPLEAVESLAVEETVIGLLGRLGTLSEIYNRGDIPDIASKFNRDLFNTYRSYQFRGHVPIQLTRHADARGSFFEIVRTHGGPGQSSFSTTQPGISRGDHFHRRKVERFTVLAGNAKISLRRLFTRDVIEFSVSGDAPVAVDMPTMWSHNIVNSGPDVLYTSFWANEIFNPESPDTIAEAVHV